MRKPNMTKLTAIVEKFNSDFPIGTRVVLRKDGGVYEKTTVMHPAYVLGAHSAVAHFEGVRGCYSIEGRVTSVKHNRRWVYG